MKPQCEVVLRVEECGVVRRVSHRPLAVGVQEVVSEDVEVVRGVGHPPGHGGEVSHCVVRGDVPGPDCGIMG